MTNQITEVRLCSVPLTRDYAHTLYFPNPKSQLEYFVEQTKKGVESLSYQRKDEFIRFPALYDDIVDCNYVIYNNGGKWYFAFITDMKYKNDEMTEIYIETDVIQTYMWDYHVQPSFIEREHVDDDTPGLHIQDEGLQIGDYICKAHLRETTLSSLSIVIGVTEVLVYDLVTGKPTKETEKVVGTIYNGLPSGLRYLTFPCTDDGIKELQSALEYYDEAAAGEAIQCMFLAPTALCQKEKESPGGWLEEWLESHMVLHGDWVGSRKDPLRVYINHQAGESGPPISPTESIYDFETVLPLKSDTLYGYENVRNNKLLTNPFQYLLVANNNGVSVPFNYEDFFDYRKKEDGSIDRTPITPKFLIEACLSPGCSIRMVPVWHKGLGVNNEEGINLGKFPALNWSSDVYTNWLTQNAVNIGVDIASSVIMTGIGVLTAPATGGASLAITGAQGVSSVANTMGEIYKASKTPAQSKGNTNCGDIVTVSDNNTFHFYLMSIKPEYARIIDDYFDMYGYKVCEVKQPNVAHRANHWYTKTIDVAITGNVPIKDMEKIKRCYNNGITFWRNPRTMFIYKSDNSIV